MRIIVNIESMQSFYIILFIRINVYILVDCGECSLAYPSHNTNFDQVNLQVWIILIHT
jgi:hypothetical protein